MKDKKAKPDKSLAAVCGLFCEACTFYIGTKEDPKRLEMLASRFGLPVAELECHGCRSEKRLFYCRNNCKMARCAAEKGISFCVECQEYPCKELKDFQTQMPHRIELYESQERVKEVGWEKWCLEMKARFSCPKCGTVNSAYDVSCRKCGKTPSCTYVKLHKNEIEDSANRLKL